jgi:dipeptidyl aminopeptidase/acylaminoacyl peptidase
VKARRDSTFILTRSSFSDCPDLYVGTPRLDRLTRLTDINPQQREYLWGTAELIRWKMKDGTPLEGLLYRPGGFEKGKRYPLIVYYYERNADYLHRYWPPSPSRSTVSPSFYTSRGYAFFIPDIRYRRGHPGMSALDAIVSGTRKVLSLGFVDSTRMGLQGQSWGGYQTAFLVTRTGMFRAAMAGAPVSNMTSAYDGIRLESGVIRQFQYEKSQSRIGATLWERPDLYLENSPLFRADRVTTPLLIMHNDNDGAVPWQQGMEMFGALRRLDKPVWMLVYNKEEHNLMQRRNMKDLSIRMAQFFDHYLQGAPLPVWMRTGRPAIEKNTTMAIDTTATGGGTPGR